MPDIDILTVFFLLQIIATPFQSSLPGLLFCRICVAVLLFYLFSSRRDTTPLRLPSRNPFGLKSRVDSSPAYDFKTWHCLFGNADFRLLLKLTKQRPRRYLGPCMGPSSVCTIMSSTFCVTIYFWRVSKPQTQFFSRMYLRIRICTKINTAPSLVLLLNQDPRRAISQLFMVGFSA